MVCLLTAVIFSLHYQFAKSILSEGVPSLSLSSARGLFGGGGLFLVLLLRGGKLEFKQLSLTVFIISFFGFFLNQLLFMKGLSMSTPLNAAILSNTIALVSLIFAYLQKVERPCSRTILGIVLGLVGVSLTIGFSQTGLTQTLVLGNVSIFLNVISFSFAFVLIKKEISQGSSSLKLSAYMCSIGGLMLGLCHQFDFSKLWNYSVQSTEHAGHVFFEIMISTALVYGLNNWCLKHLPLSHVSFFIYLQPPISSIIGFFGTGSLPGTMQIVGFLTIAAAGGLVLKRNRET